MIQNNTLQFENEIQKIKEESVLQKKEFMIL